MHDAAPLPFCLIGGGAGLPRVPRRGSARSPNRSNLAVNLSIAVQRLPMR
jgi:hypothetical protein